MAVNPNTLFSITVRGRQSGQQILWTQPYVLAAGGAVGANEILDAFLSIYQDRVVAAQSSSLVYYEVVLQQYRGTEIRYKPDNTVRYARFTPGAATTRNFNSVGGRTGAALPTYAAVTCSKTAGEARLVDPTDGTVTSTFAPGRLRGKMSFGGMLEIDTVDEDNPDNPNYLVKTGAGPGTLNWWKTSAQSLIGFDAVPPAGGTGQVYMVVLSARRDSGWRIDKGTPPSADPLTWTPALAAASVEGVIVSELVSTRVSRRQKKRYN